MKKTNLKKCSACQNSFPATKEFWYSDRSKRDNFNGRCIICAKKYYKKQRSNKIYNAFRAMKERCSNPNFMQFRFYGGRGIKCLIKSWKDIQKAIGLQSSKTSVIGRIDTRKHYSLDNIKWTTVKEQNRNKYNNTLDKETAATIRQMFRNGLSRAAIRTRFGELGHSVYHIIAGRQWNE